MKRGFYFVAVLMVFSLTRATGAAKNDPKNATK